jgi:hypothetical protein
VNSSLTLRLYRAGQGEAQVVGICGASGADQTGLRRHEFEMAFVAMPTRLTDGELAFLDFGWHSAAIFPAKSFMGGIADLSVAKPSLTAPFRLRRYFAGGTRQCRGS